jgi:2-polyprenyl-6-methoxyphenol hydroxylase-like FAD-dependent oxidoreductase
MLAGHVGLRAGVDASLACIEVTADGWVFMAPVAHDRAFVQAMVADVGPEPQGQLESALAATREIRGRLTPSVERVTAFEAAPSIAESVCRPGWIAVGDRAMAMDPVCGDGVGYALRDAILGAAVLDAIASGEDTAGCLAHFQSRLEAAFVRHLKACHELYSRAGFGRAWDSELEACARGAQLDTRASARAQFRFGLRGFTLAPLERVTPG